MVLFIYFGSSQLLLTLSDGFTLNLGVVQIPVQMQIENFDVSPFLCGVIALSLLYSAYASQTLRGALKAVPARTMGIWLCAGDVESGDLLPSGDAPDVASCPAGFREPVAGAAEKDTALVSLISVNDLMLQTKSIATRTPGAVYPVHCGGGCLPVITLLSQYILKRIDLRATRFERRPG